MIAPAACEAALWYGGLSVKEARWSVDPEELGSLPVGHPMPSPKNVSRTCVRCGTSFFTSVSEVKRGRKYCSKRCGSSATHSLRPLHGCANGNWKGGQVLSAKGYWYVLDHSHPGANADGYVKRATLVLESSLGRFLEQGELAHHLDEDKTNDEISNLQLMTVGEHTRLHHKRKPCAIGGPLRRVVWPSDEELLRQAQIYSVRKLGQLLGVSGSAVWQRLRKLKPVRI